MTSSTRHVLLCAGRLAPLWEPCPEAWRGEEGQQMTSVWTDAQEKGWTRVNGTHQTLCRECARDARAAMTLGPCAGCGRLRLHQRAYIHNPELRRDRVRASTRTLCQGCYVARRRGKPASMDRPVAAELSDAELRRLRKMVGAAS